MCTDVSVWSSGPQLSVGEAQPPARVSFCTRGRLRSSGTAITCFRVPQQKTSRKENTEPRLLARDATLLFLYRSPGRALFQPSIAWTRAGPAK